MKRGGHTVARKKRFTLPPLDVLAFPASLFSRFSLFSIFDVQSFFLDFFQLSGFCFYFGFEKDLKTKVKKMSEGSVDVF